MLIVMQNIGRVYRKGPIQVCALHPLSLEIAEGDFTAIMGPSGSGKSTLLHILGCLDPPSQGTYVLDGIDVSGADDARLSQIRNQNIGFVFQSFNLLPQHTVLQNIEAPLLYHPPTSAVTTPQTKLTRAKELAEQVGLGNRLRHRPSELSGGEMQRVAIARALATHPRVILADEPTGNLDTSTGQEIMKILQALHRQGHTIIIVTHEKAIAEYAERILFLKDGRIEREESTDRQAWSSNNSSQQAAAPVPEADKRGPSQSRGKSLMASVFRSLIPVLQTALRGVLLHKLRSFLSVLGIVFGIGAIIAMLAIGGGAKQEIIEQIALLGTNHISVKAVSIGGEGIQRGREQLSRGVTSTDVERIAQISTFISHLAPVREFSSRVQFQHQMTQASIIGTSPDYVYTGNLQIRQGRFLTDADEREVRRVCVLGSEIQQTLFAFQNPVGQQIKIRNDWFRVIGTLENKVVQQKKTSSIQMRNVNKQVFIPLATSAMFVNAQKENLIQEISIQVDTADHVDDVARLIRTVLTRVHHGAEDYEVVVPRELLKQSQQAQEVFNVVMGSIAGISLLVGGIGIMNIMLATVTERTREIGIRRAIGASRRMVLLQFLFETLVLTLVGGCLGVLLGIGGAYAISLFAGWRTVVSAQTILLAFGISAVVGIAFGLYPASQGARMDPIAALRYE